MIETAFLILLAIAGLLSIAALAVGICEYRAGKAEFESPKGQERIGA